MKIINAANRTRRIIALIALIALCAALLAPGANAATAKRLNLADIVGEYEFMNTNQNGVVRATFVKDGNKLVEVREIDGKTYRGEYKYDPSTGVATRYAEGFSDGHTISQILTFSRIGEAIGLSLEDTLVYTDKATVNYRFYGFKIPAAKASIPIDQIEGTYEYQGPGSKTVHQIEMVRSGDRLIARWEDGHEDKYFYYPERAVASKSAKGKNDRFVHTVWSFSKNDGVIEVFIQESDITRNKSCKISTFRGQKINTLGSGGLVAEYATQELPKLSDFQWYINDIQKTGSPQHLKGVKFIKDYELVAGGWKGIVFDNDADPDPRLVSRLQLL